MLLNWFDPQIGYVLPEMLLLMVLALVISSIGFYRVVYFISIGYALSIVAMALVAPLKHFENLTWALALQNSLLVIWGIRLGIYLRGDRDVHKFISCSNSLFDRCVSL